MPLEPEPVSTGAPRAPWLSIVGIGAEGERGLSEAARGCILRAELVFGGARQLRLVEGWVGGRAQPWPTPFAEGVAQVLARRGAPTCVLASGDPFFYGVGATLAPHLARGEFECHPVPSSVSLAAARLGWPLQDTEVVSLHGRDLHDIIRHLAPGRRLLALSWGRDTPAELAELLVARGFGPSRLVVLEALGGPEERLRETRARSLALDTVQDLNVVALELSAEPQAFVLPCRASLPDGAFESDGQLTKRDVRAVTLSALAPRAGERLWDIGAGSGSVGIEWMLAHPACRAIAIERDAARCARIASNARRLGVPALEVVHAAAPDALDGLPPPDAVFVGGGASEPGLLEAARRALPPGGRLVANAVALESQALLLEAYRQHGGELCRLAFESAAPLGGMTCFRPALAVLQWRFVRS
ncbi:MAG TPA: precorrin-6y C5,15-methyltransferase (decarboxylating) subunit CbiE [Polyangiaceae bacterium]|nr:precorrin-6y C5,15-methyltransferase (decarboxylating) subunit CbiE [Polyangiaceae bacterium]